MSIWGDASAALSGQSTYAVGERVCGALDGRPGSVHAVDNDAEYPRISVVWDDGGTEAVVYPADTIMIRRAMPWE